MKISEKQIIDSLKEIGKIRKTKKNIPQNIFYALCEELIVNSVEIIPINEMEEIYLIKRNSDDKYYPNLWHNTGSICLPNETITETLCRVMSKELGLKFNLKRLNFVGVLELNKGKGKREDPRQQVRNFVFLLELKSSELKVEEDKKFFKFSKIPKNSVLSQKNLSFPVIKKFLKNRQIVISFA